MKTLNKLEKLNSLFTYYEALLTEKQRNYFKSYYYDDLSLAEIAEISQVSRTAVYDQLKQVEIKLLELEANLKLKEKHDLRVELIEKYQETQDALILEKLKEMD